MTWLASIASHTNCSEYARATCTASPHSDDSPPSSHSPPPSTSAA